MSLLISLLIPILVLLVLGLVFGAILGYADIRFKTEGDPIVNQIDAILPQTQCGQCGHPGCRPYAESIANEGEAINHCPPGGEDTIIALADCWESTETQAGIAAFFAKTKAPWI